MAARWIVIAFAAAACALTTGFASGAEPKSASVESLSLEELSAQLDAFRLENEQLEHELEELAEPPKSSPVATTPAANRVVPARAVQDAPPSEVPPAPAVDVETPEYSPENLLERLERAEAQLKALQEPGGLDALKEHWEKVKDPEVVSVDQQTAKKEPEKKEEKKEKKWFDKLSIRGYAQFRFNETLSEDEDGAPAQHVGDRSVGENQNFLIRRARIIISGDVSDHLYVYLQPDFASTVPGSTDSTYYGQMRDWYGDIYLDDYKEYRIRVGQSKIPYGWENLQSSSNRLPLDRNDAMNTASRNERDLGAFFYWTPEEAQHIFKYVIDEGLKGSGNYGVFGVGLYNGQGGSLLEQNDNLHVVTRLAVPFVLPNCQIVEVGAQAYSGKYVVLSSAIQPLGVGPAVRPLGTLETGNDEGIRDERVGATFVYYPQPLGFQAEWNVGNGPALNDTQTEVIEQSLGGGYGMLFYRYVSPSCGTFLPFARWNRYEGGWKAERNSPNSDVTEGEVGVEWQLNPQVEIVTQYTVTDRTNTIAQSVGESYRQFEGELWRTQVQINY